ncbi:hypothetical protein B0A48_08392 [Cryoendolithus antarcticus]|uniref:Uncharacterized protein n=1 Tax=Cryoendolithus antarcticus TaxID=1507870 RepID=A0A1V8T5B7_9PEZI|nr:hypothetical protein B0A48_08392 [Cryoendolithus antarcticus]
MERLHWVAASPVFRKGVRELIFDTASYCARPQEGERGNFAKCMVEQCTESALTDVGLPGCNTELGVAHYAALLQRLEQAHRDEDRALSACLENPRDLDTALMALERCHTLTITTWSGPGKNFLTMDSLTGRNGAVPPPIAELMNRQQSFAIQNAARCMLLGDPNQPRHRFTALNLRSADCNMNVSCTRNSQGLRLPGFAMMWHMTNPFGPTAPRGYMAASSLRRLRLELELETLDCIPLGAFEAAKRDASFATLWPLAADLQELDLEIRTRAPILNNEDRVNSCVLAMNSTLSKPSTRPFFPSLTAPTLRSTWLETEHLIAFITAHKGTLQHISLQEITLGNGDGHKRPHRFEPWLYLRPHFSNYMSDYVHTPNPPGRAWMAFTTTPGTYQQPWLGIMRACQNISALRVWIFMHPPQVRSGSCLRKMTRANCSSLG